MLFNKDDYKTEIFPNVNDLVIAPSLSKAGNGSHLISKFNGFVDIVETITTSHKEQIDLLVSNAGGKSNWVSIDSDYSAQFNDSILIIPCDGLTITLPETPLMGSYVELLKLDENTIVSFNKGGNDKINGSYSWANIQLITSRKRVLLVWTNNDNDGWMVIDKSDFMFVGQQA